MGSPKQFVIFPIKFYVMRICNDDEKSQLLKIAQIEKIKFNNDNLRHDII